LKIFADLKIMDAGEHETETAIEAGADIISVLGVAANATITASVDTAHKRGKHILVDMIDVPDLAARAKEVDTLGVDYICVHTAFDIQASGKNPLEELQIISAVVKNAKCAAAGGIKLTTLPHLIKLNPAIIVVGGGITQEADKRETAKKIKACINERGQP
jgi:3-hexulose-6-phosphate synthase